LEFLEAEFRVLVKLFECRDQLGRTARNNIFYRVIDIASGDSCHAEGQQHQEPHNQVF
jgi:hypothetical protein